MHCRSTKKSLYQPYKHLGKKLLTKQSKHVPIKQKISLAQPQLHFYLCLQTYEDLLYILKTLFANHSADGSKLEQNFRIKTVQVLKKCESSNIFHSNPSFDSIYVTTFVSHKNLKSQHLVFFAL